MLDLHPPLELIFQRGGKQESLVFPHGITRLSIDDKGVFNTLLVRNQNFYNLELQINGKTILPSENDDHSIFMLAVNSLNLHFQACFVLKKDEREKRIEDIQARLLTLKELPLDEYRERRAKIQKILHVLEEEGVAYILLDENIEENRRYKYIYEPEIEKVTSYPIIILTQDKTAKITPVVSVATPKGEKAAITQTTVVPENKNSEVSLVDFSKVKNLTSINAHDKTDFKSNLNIHLHLLKKNIGVFLLQALIVAFTSFLYGYIITTFTDQNAFLYVLLLIAAMVVPFFVVISVFDFLDRGEDEQVMIYYRMTLRISEICIITGIGLGLVIFHLLAKNNIFLESANVKTISYLFPVLMNIPLILVPIFARQIRKGINKIKKKLIK